jgi:protein-L-isoaspartate(D-aspartate) O-methyltransferase
MAKADIPQLQRALVETLRREGVLHVPAVEQAFLTVPRHVFLPDEPVEKVYADVAIMVKQDEQGRWTSSSSQPAIMAIMLEQLDLQPGMRLLEIGAGTGFNAALMAALVGQQGRVVSVDIQPDLVESARRRLEAAGYAWVEVVSGDGGYGYLEGAPYDRIILTVAAPVITPAWWEQLAEGGRIVLPLEIFGSQKSIAFARSGPVMESVSVSDCGFMMLQGAFAPGGANRLTLGPDPRVYLTGVSETPMPASLLYAYLGGPWEDWASGVRASVFDLFGGLRPWLSVHLLPGSLASLVAEDERAEPSVIPPLIYVGRGREMRLMQTLVTMGADGAAALVRPPGQPAPFRDWETAQADEQLWRTPFELYIRRLGPDSAQALRLAEAVSAWDAAGRPSTDRLRLRAVRHGSGVEAGEGEHLVEKPWTNIFVRFS